MNAFKRILVDVDSTASAHPALQRAILLARNPDATLTIVDVLTIPPDARHYFPPALEQGMIRERRQQLAAVADQVEGVRVESKLLVGRPATVLIQEVLRAGHDLLIRSHAHESAASGPKAFGAVDMELLRKCPCPVLLVRHGSPASHPRIVAAVDASTEDVEEQALNAKIVETALLMALHLDAGAPRLLQAWTPFGERMVRAHSADDQFASYVDSARQRAEADLARLVQTFDGRLAATPSALRRGKAEDVIPEFVVAEGVDLVVMGTVARAGVAGMLIGNTAERVLRKLPSSVLTVKPDGFVTPVQPAPSESTT
jgi:nucleotide-binding universal stress UspA family protein